MASSNVPDSIVCTDQFLADIGVGSTEAAIVAANQTGVAQASANEKNNLVGTALGTS